MALANYIARVTSTDVGLNSFRATDVDETALQTIKSSAGNVYGFNLLNPNGSAVFVKFFDVDGGATLGSDSPIYTVQIPANGSVFVGVEDLPQFRFENQLEIAATGAVGDTDTTAITTDVIAHVYYG